MDTFGSPVGLCATGGYMREYWLVLAADDPPRLKLFKFPPSADNDRGVGLSKRVDNRLAKGGRPKHTNIPDKIRI
jgi:hypothetical protein